MRQKVIIGIFTPQRLFNDQNEHCSLYLKLSKGMGQFDDLFCMKNVVPFKATPEWTIQSQNVKYRFSIKVKKDSQIFKRCEYDKIFSLSPALELFNRLTSTSSYINMCFTSPHHTNFKLCLLF